jgi:hypothetical protein
MTISVWVICVTALAIALVIRDATLRIHGADGKYDAAISALREKDAALLRMVDAVARDVVAAEQELRTRIERIEQRDGLKSLNKRGQS